MNYRPLFAPLDTEDESAAFGEFEREAAIDFEAVNLRRAASHLPPRPKRGLAPSRRLT